MSGVTNPGKRHRIACPLAARHGGAAGGTRGILFRRVQAQFKGVF